MIKLGVNTVLFKAFSFREAAQAIKLAGYDGLEISAIQGMCEHLNLDDWKAQKADLLDVMAEVGLTFLSTEVASLDKERLKKAFEACAEIGIPVINVGPGGKSGDEETLRASVETLADLAAMAETYGVTLCVKAHVGAAIYNTPTTLRAMDAITSPAFGIDMDPSHIYRAGELPEWRFPRSYPGLSMFTFGIVRVRGRHPEFPAYRHVAVEISIYLSISRLWWMAITMVLSVWK